MGEFASAGDGVYGFPRSLADTIEPRAPIDKLGFTAGYPLLEIDENMQERVSMHAAQYTTTPISWALKRLKKRAARGQAGGDAAERTVPGSNSSR